MDIDISGARILIQIPELGGFMLTETVVVTWVVMLVLVLCCRFMTKNLQVHPTQKRQIVAEWLVTSVRDLVQTNMGARYADTWYVPFIGAMFALSAGCSLSSLVGAYAPTSDLSTVLGWALFVFALITWTKIKTNGLRGYLRDFTTPIPIMTPFNIIGEIATPVSMAFRHFGNIASGSVITALVYGALTALSGLILGLLPGAAGELLSQIPVFSFGLPAILSLYFDFFSSVLQAFIFCMLTMMYVGGAASTGE
ncbi:MAG TPA: F0F1 ATP synthase subunit A [Candidatus Ventricola intestinavium]|nr:F0F1 ATP synthase subunit A [Candidatus Ventricola intestinavium]